MRPPCADNIMTALTRAEQFVRGFEGDETQEGIDDLLAAIRAAMGEIGSARVVAADDHETRAEAAARALGWDHGGDGDGVIFHTSIYSGWKEAVSWEREDGPVYATWVECCDAEDIDLGTAKA